MCVAEEASGGGIEIVSSLTLQNYSLDSLRLNPQRMTKALFFSLPHSFSLMFSADKLLASHKQKSRRDKARAKNVSRLSSSFLFKSLFSHFVPLSG